jgi:hypothetical protein
MADSAKEALHDAYFDGIPVDDGPNYAKGLKALAEYIDQAVTPRLDQTQHRVEEAEEDLKNMGGSLVDKARGLEEVRQDIEDLYDQLDACVQGLTEHEEKIGKREREIGGLDTRIGRIEDRLEGLEDAVYADEAGSTAQKALRMARRAEQKADDTDALLGELLGEGVLRAESVTTGTFTDGTASEQAAKEGRWDDVELGLNHVAALVQKAFGGAELESVLSAEGRAFGLAFLLEEGGDQYVAFPTLEVRGRGRLTMEYLTTVLRDTYLGELREDEAKAPGGETPDDETPDEEDPTGGASSTGDLTPGQQAGALKGAINRAFEEVDLHGCVAFPDLGHVRFSVRSHRYRAKFIEADRVFVEEVADGMLKRNERAALVQDALELALS